MKAVLHLVRSFLRVVGAAAFRSYGAVATVRDSRRQLSKSRASPLRILVIRLDLLGDVVFSIPAIEALAAAFPRASIDVLVLPYTAPIVRRVAAVTKVYELDINRYRRPQGWLAVGDLIRTIRRLRRQRYDLAVGLHGLMGGVFAALSGARWRIGYEYETFRGCYNLPVLDRRYVRHQHEVEYCLDVIRALGVPAAAGARPRLRSSVRPLHGSEAIPDHENSACSALGETPPPPQPSPVETEGETRPSSSTRRDETLLPLRGRLPTPPYAVLVPGASNGAAKRWPPRLWAQLGDRLAADLGLTLVIAGGATERALAQDIVDIAAAPMANLAGSTSLEDLMCLLADAEVVVAGDTGPLHLAAAVGTPVVGIYGPTDPAHTGALNERAEVVRLGVACSPCYDLRTPADCKLPDRSTICMTDLAPTRVFHAVTRVLGRDPAATRMGSG